MLQHPITKIIGYFIFLLGIAFANDQNKTAALLGKVSEDPDEIDNRGNCKSMKIKYTEIGIICKSQDSGDEILLNTLLNEYYDLSLCQNKSPTKESVRRLYDINRKLYKFKWDKINMPAMLYSFTYQLEKSKKFYISPMCIPQLLNMTEISSWVDFFSKKILSMLTKKLDKDKVWYSPFTRLDMNESETMHKILPRFTYDFSNRKSDGSKLDRDKLIQSFNKMFEGFGINTSISKFLRQDKFLLYAAWMGSEKALIKSKSMIDEYFEILKMKNSGSFTGLVYQLRKKRNENILTAINALKEFNSPAPDKTLSIQNFLQQHAEYAKTPQYIIDAIKK